MDSNNKRSTSNRGFRVAILNYIPGNHRHHLHQTAVWKIQAAMFEDDGGDDVVVEVVAAVAVVAVAAVGKPIDLYFLPWF